MIGAPAATPSTGLPGAPRKSPLRKTRFCQVVFCYDGADSDAAAAAVALLGHGKLGPAPSLRYSSTGI
jgi:hypothetical protein